MKCILNVKKTSNLIKVISSYRICSGIKSRQVQKKHLPFSTKNFRFCSEFLRSSHQVTFNHSISCVLLTDKPNESC